MQFKRFTLVFCIWKDYSINRIMLKHDSVNTAQRSCNAVLWKLNISHTQKCVCSALNVVSIWHSSVSQRCETLCALCVRCMNISNNSAHACFNDSIIYACVVYWFSIRNTYVVNMILSATLCILVSAENNISYFLWKHTERADSARSVSAVCLSVQCV